jgi:hypothetical protein
LGGANAGEEDAFVAKFDGAGERLWVDQFGTARDDAGAGISTDGGDGVYVSGFTAGSLAAPITGSGAAFLRRYDADGGTVWTRQLGTKEGTYGVTVAADTRGNAFIAGSTAGSLSGPSSGGVDDAIVASYDASGRLRWIQQFGTSDAEGCESVSIDGLHGIYVVGYTGGNLGGPYLGNYDAFVAKISDVPEPGSLALSVLGAGALVGHPIRRRSRIIS